MGAINTTGNPTIEDYLVGGGQVYLASLQSDGKPGAYFRVGNTPDMSFAVESETYDHFSTQNGTRKLDARTVIEQTSTFSFNLENINAQNLAYFFSGSFEERTNPAVAGFTDAVLIEDGSIEPLHYYQVMAADGTEVLGLAKADLTINTTDGTPVTLVQDTDYTVQELDGTIFLNDTATVQTAITGAVGLTSTLVANAGAEALDLVQIQTQSEVEVAVKFISINERDRRTYYFVHKATLASDGDFSLIGDEAAQLPFTGSVEDSDAYTYNMDIVTPQGQ